MIKERITQLFLLASSVLLTLVLFEAAFRIFTFTAGQPSAGALPNSTKNIDARNSHTSLTLGALIQPSEFPDTVYELKPNLDVIFQGVRVQTNRFGMRGPGIEKAKPPQTFRIVGLGDSIMFGWGVKETESYLRVTESRLNETAPSGRRYEVLNFGVPGYNTTMELSTLENKALEFSPDLIVIHFVNNDLEVPAFMMLPDNPWSLSHSYLKDFISSRLSHRRKEKLVSLDLAGFEGEAKREVVAQYKHMVGIRPYIAAMDRIAAISKSRNIPVVVLIGGATKKRRNLVVKVSKQHGFEVIPVKGTVDRYFKSLGHPVTIEERQQALMLSKTDPHPTPLGHRLYADALVGRLVRRGLLNLK